MYDMMEMKKNEISYVYSQSQQISIQTGLVGYVRADMGSNGLGFYSTWNEFRKDLNTDEFKKDLDMVINDLRAGKNCLSNREALANFCYRSPDIAITEDMRSFGIRVNTDKCAFLLRLNPYKGEYNLYCYCYQKEWLDRHIQNAERGIQFIDSSYNEKFRLPDNGKIKITMRDGKSIERRCRYIDEYHLEVGDKLFHICEFAERMEQDGNRVEPADGTSTLKEKEKNKGKER